MNNTIDLTMYRLGQHIGLDKLRETLKKDLKAVFINEYCDCEQPEGKRMGQAYVCNNCDRLMQDVEPPADVEIL